MQYRYNTPERMAVGVDNKSNSNRQHHYSSNGASHQPVGIDYKNKTFQLMQTITQMQIRQKQANRTIFYLQRQMQTISRDLQDFLSALCETSLANVKLTFIQMAQKLSKGQREKQRPLLKEQKISQEYQKILREYKQIITAQQQKMSKYQAKWKQKQTILSKEVQQLSVQKQNISQQMTDLSINCDKKLKQNQQIHLKKLQQLSIKLGEQKQELIKKQDVSKKLRQQSLKTILQLQQSNKQLSSDLQMIKTEFRQLLIEKQSVEDKHERLKKKYKQEIQHFQMIEKEVEEKLIDVQKQIQFYKEEREGNLSKINELRHQINQLRQNQRNQEQFSFGGWVSTAVQTEATMQNQQDNKNSQKGLGQFDQLNNYQVTLNAECYQISIKSLLQQNSRLKRTLILLDKYKSGQKLPPQAQLELKLLKGLSSIPLSGNYSQMTNKNDKNKQNNQLDSPQFQVVQQSNQDNENIINQFKDEDEEDS